MKTKQFNVTRLFAVVDPTTAQDILEILGTNQEDHPSVSFEKYYFSRDGRPFIAMLSSREDNTWRFEFAYRYEDCRPGDGGKETYFENYNAVINYDDGENELGEQICLQTFISLLKIIDKSKLTIY